MPIVGNRKTAHTFGNAYKYDGIASFAKSFNECAANILQEGIDLFADPIKALNLPATRSMLKEFYTSGTYDANEFYKINSANAAEMIQEQEQMAEELFEIGKSIIRYFPPNGTAGFARFCVNAYNLDPCPPARIIATISFAILKFPLFNICIPSSDTARLIVPQKSKYY